MARGLKKHLKRLNAPKHWMLDKLGGAFAPKPSSGPHKSRECLPLVLILRNRLKYALIGSEANAILMQRHVMVDHKVRTDKTFPAGFMGMSQFMSQLKRFFYTVVEIRCWFFCCLKGPCLIVYGMGMIVKRSIDLFQIGV
ncbi:unnamed protein product [Linum tenue]|uniref:Small ribosomal subunit protein eS4 N-terminal domain-containing protein n=1 Tax=Linum tenue TaxID=586396 RepID=A0AAV0I386_9ROSI|nr:unnamed protein product [Linum tenue]